MTSNQYFSPTRSGRPRIVNRRRRGRGEYDADIVVGSSVIGHVTRAASGSGGGFGASDYQAFVSGRRITYARTVSQVLADLYEAQDAREF